MEVRELLSSLDFDGDNTPFVKGSARCALEDKDPEIGKQTVLKLLDEIDQWIPTPSRDLERPFILPVEGVFSVPGRGTVITGTIERGTMKKGAEAKVIGFGSKIKTTVTGKGNWVDQNSCTMLMDYNSQVM